MAYYTSNEEHPIDILNIKGLEAKVKAHLPLLSAQWTEPYLSLL